MSKRWGRNRMRRARIREAESLPGWTMTYDELPKENALYFVATAPYTDRWKMASIGMDWRRYIRYGLVRWHNGRWEPALIADNNGAPMAVPRGNVIAWQAVPDFPQSYKQFMPELQEPMWGEAG